MLEFHLFHFIPLRIKKQKNYDNFKILSNFYQKVKNFTDFTKFYQIFFYLKIFSYYLDI